MTLFDDFAEDDEMHMTPELNNIKEWPFSEVLQKEKEVLGFFWSGHPLDKHKNLIESVSNVESNIVQRKNASPPQNVIIAGVVNAVNKKRTKRGNQFAIVEMEDLKGKYEICLFGDKYDQLASRFVAGKEFLIKGRNNYQGDGLFSVLPDCIYDLNEFSQNCSGELTIEISQEALSDDLCEYLVGLSAPENRVSLNIVLKTNDFKTLNCQSALKLAVNDEILMKLKDVSENKPVLKIN